MTVTVTWDSDTPLTGQPDAGSASKVYTEAGSGTVTITDEAIGGESVTLHYTVPLDLTTVEPTPDTVDSAYDESGRTLTVAGEGFGPNATGTVAVATGAPGAYGTTVVSTAATTNTAGVFSGVSLTIPSDLDAGDYHIEATFGSIADLDAAFEEKRSSGAIMVVVQDLDETREAFDLRLAKLKSQHPGTLFVCMVDELPERS